MPVDEIDEVALRAQERVGVVLREKYRLDRVLGIGGMAVVFAATHRNQKQFAVKMLHPELSMRKDIRTRFLREGYAANSFKHPGAVAVLDDDVAEDGAAFLVMELLEGSGVEEMWERFGRQLPLVATLALAHQLLDVLAAAHAKGIVHRDIKPANLFLTEDGTVKVLDFGIARVRDALSSGAMATGTGVLLGTPAFMAPEQALAKSSEIDGQTDVWAVGATLFTLISGHVVHDGESASQILVHAATQPARSITTLVPGTPLAVVELIDRALAFDKSRRWVSAEVMRDAIRDTYAATFGEPLSRAPLLGLFQRAGASSSPHPGSTPFVIAHGNALPLAPTSPSAPGSNFAVSERAQLGSSTSTAQPVSTDAPDSPRTLARRARTSIVAAVAVVAAVLLGIWLLLGGPRGSSPGAHADSWSAEATHGAPSPSSSAPLPASPPDPVVTPTPETPPTAPPSTAHAAHHTTTPSASKVAPSTPCKLVTTIDANGEPHFSCPCGTCQ